MHHGQDVFDFIGLQASNEGATIVRIGTAIFGGREYK